MKKSVLAGIESTKASLHFLFPFKKGKIKVRRKGSCPKCGDYMDPEDDCCQTCGYPYTD